MPVTVVWGVRDRLLLARRQAARARRVLPGRATNGSHGAGHLPMWDEPGGRARRG